MSVRAPHSQSWSWLPRGFATTRWSLVRRAAIPGAEDDSASELCRLYWHPLYVFLRTRGSSKQEAQDLVQTFLVKIVDGDILKKADGERGHFRSFLLTLLQRHAAGDFRYRTAKKRGGSAEHVSLDWAMAESLFRNDLQHHSSPEDNFRRALAAKLVEDALALLGERYERTGKGQLCDLLLPALEGPLVGEVYADLADRLRMREGALRVAVKRLRERFREALCQTAAIALRLPAGPELEEELRQIFG